jgi:hypothetical protein
MCVVSEQLALLMTKLGNKKTGRKEKLALLWGMIGIECPGKIDFVITLR